SAYINYATAGVAFGMAPSPLAVGGDFTTGFYDDDLNLSGSSTYTNAGDGPSGDRRLWMRGYSGQWSISAHNNGGYCMLLMNGSFVANLRPTLGASPSWWYAESNYYPEYGGLTWFSEASVYIGVRKVGSSGHTWNQIFRWPLEDAGG